MLVCQCNIIAEREITRVIREMLSEDPWQIIVPAKVYRALDKRCKCAGCVPNVVDLIEKVSAEYHNEIAQTPAAAPAIRPPAPPRRKLGGLRHERRSAGHRAAQ